MRHFTFALVAVTACAAPQPDPKSIGLGGITGSTGSTGTTGSVTPPGPTITESTPPTGAKHIPPLASVTVRFSAAMDPSSITRTTVHTYEIGDGANITKASLLSLSADGKELTIKANFSYGSVTRVTFNGVKDTTGTALAKQTLEWLPTSPFEYVESFSAGVITQVTAREFATSGAMSRYTIYDAAGPDGTWRTADDVVDKIYSYVSNAAGFNQEVVSYDAPGPDGLWKTSDDVINEITIYERAADGQLTRLRVFNGAGTDGVWRTSNDSLSTYATYTYDAQGEATSYQYFGQGPDGLWLTADDVTVSQQLFVNNDSFDIVAENDGTSDYEVVYERDERGNNVARRAYNRGPDGQAGTADDINGGSQTQTYRDVYPTGVEWRNAAGVLDGYRVINWNETLNTTSSYTQYSGFGADGVKGTSDDPISSYQESTTSGGVTTITTYNAAGPDGIWKTSDDRASSRAYLRAGY